MSAAKHTPGPWFVTETAPDRAIDYNGETFVRWQSNGMPLATLGNYAPDERRANARLIAAAPELLAVCHMATMLRRVGGMLPGVREIIDELVKDADAAIEKATGEVTQ